MTEDISLNFSVGDFITIRINKSYREGMTAEELYDATRGIWKRNLNTLSDYKFALSIYKGIVKEVYRIDRWFYAVDDPIREVSYDSSVAFEGRIANDEIRSIFIGCDLSSFFTRGSNNPVTKLNDSAFSYALSNYKTGNRILFRDSSNKKYWLYSPGENASNWDEFYDERIMGLGWDYIEDLKKYDSQEAIEKALPKEEANSDQKINAKALWQFANEMKPGDVVFAKKGKGRIIGSGEVASDYSFNDDRDELKHVRSVNWKNKGDWPNPGPYIRKTLTEISAQEAEKLNELFKDELQFKNPFSWTLYESKNMILRGAPGTGKSYLAKQIAADIVSNGNCSEYSELTDEQKKQIEFVQFHPNYDYSDFVEGLRPTKPDDEGTIGFELHPGIFSLFISRARTNFEDSQKTAETIEKEFSVQSAMKEFFSSIEFGRTTFKISSGNEFKIVSVDDSRIKINIPGNECVKLTLKLDDLRRMLESDEHFTNPSDVTKFFGRQWREQGFSYDLALYKEIKNKIKENDSAVNKTVKKNYVFIIDEINRGEISKIFGELFYAIDPGYRGRSGEISTQYANLHDNLDEKFYVPDNVFIIGTMNDIDRSVDSFDFAMRRRFRFVELKASDRQRQEEMLNCLNEDVKNEAIKRMNNLNEEIVKAEELNENYQIGAAYFLKLKSVDFDGLWTDYLQPLLQEYVRGMNDEKKILNKFAKAYGYVNLSENESEFDEDTQN